jgi:hypothetical protein
MPASVVAPARTRTCRRGAAPPTARSPRHANSRAVAGAALFVVTAGACARPSAQSPAGALPAEVDLAVDEQVVLRSVELDDYNVDGGGIASVTATPRWLLLGGLRPGRATLTLRRRGAPPASMNVTVAYGPPRRGTEVALRAGETRVLEVPEVLTYEVRGAQAFRATLENPRAVGVLGAAPGTGTLAVLGKGDSYALFRIVVRRAGD